MTLQDFKATALLSPLSLAREICKILRKLQLKWSSHLIPHFFQFHQTLSTTPKMNEQVFTRLHCFSVVKCLFGLEKSGHPYWGRPAPPRGARTPELCSHLSRLIPAIFHSALLALLALCSWHTRHSVSLLRFPHVKRYLQSKVHSLQLTPRPQQGSAWRECPSIVTHSFYVCAPRMRILHGFVTSSPTGVKSLHIIRLVLAGYGENWYEIGSVERDADAHNARSRWGRKLPAFY